MLKVSAAFKYTAIADIYDLSFRLLEHRAHPRITARVFGFFRKP
jgi:hypothetical protein